MKTFSTIFSRRSNKRQPASYRAIGGASLTAVIIFNSSILLPLMVNLASGTLNENFPALQNSPITATTAFISTAVPFPSPFHFTTTSSSTTATKPSSSLFLRLGKSPFFQPLSEEIGTSPAFNHIFFDPLSLSTESNFATFREAELKHGRVAMLAVVGNSLPELLLPSRVAALSSSSLSSSSIFPPVPNDVAIMTVPPPPPLSSEANNIMLSPSNNLAFDDVPFGIHALSVVPIVGWVQILMFVAVLEMFLFVQRDDRDMPGDYGTGYFGLRDKGRHERSLSSELENGRLAMLAFAGQVVAELVTGETVGEQIQSLFLHSPLR